jgi:plasmid stabilization system protein ParE
MVWLDNPEQRARYYDRAAAVYERIASRPGARWVEILLATEGLGDLGDSWLDNPEQRARYYDRAAAVYERIASRPGARLHEI